MAVRVAGIIFLLIAILHFLRFVLKMEVVMGGFVVPQWVSIAGFLLALLLSWWMFHFSKEK